MENEMCQPNHWFFAKVTMMALFIVSDLYLNSKIEFEALHEGSDADDKTEEDIEKIGQLQIILFGCIILVQVSTFSTFFLILCDTYPFQVGLLGALADRFKCLLVLQPLYTIITVFIGSLRLKDIFVDADSNVWRSGFYTVASSLHKVVAPLYYAAYLSGATALGNEFYYKKEAWIPSTERS